MRRALTTGCIAVVLVLAPCGQAVASVLSGAVPDGIPPRAASALAHVANLPYGGGSVLHHNRTHLVFWDPAGAGLGFDPGYTALFDRFLGGVAHDSHLQTNVYSLTGQYTDESGAAVYDSNYAGAVFDFGPLPARDPACQEPPPPPIGEGPGWIDCVTDDQIQTELSNVVAVHHLPVTLGDIYFLITPNGLGNCVTGSVPARCALGGADNGGYCAYHGSVGASDLLYAVIPYNATVGHCRSGDPRPNGSTADPGLSSLSHEHNETITDPLGNGWIDGSGNEDGDLCVDPSEHPSPALGRTGAGPFDQVIDGGHYWLQGEYSNADGGCVTQARTDRVILQLPRTISAGARAVLRGVGVAPQGEIVALRWFFGDGGTARGFRVSHGFRRAGRYMVTIRGTDTFGNWVYASRTVRVRAAPARPRRR